MTFMLIQKNLFLNNAYELKLRSYYYFFSLLLSIICCYIYSDALIYFFVNPLIIQMNSQRFIFTNLKDIFLMYLKFAFIGGFCITYPTFLIHLLFFFINGLYKHELKLLNYFYILSNILFLLGFILSYYYIVPQAWKFFLLFEQKNNFFPLHFEAKLDTYLYFTLNVLFSTIICFQLPTIIFLFLIFKKLTLNLLKVFSQRKFIYILLILISTFISSPEIINQLIISCSFLIIYEISLIMIYYYYYLIKN